jgi:hypothetical protein
MAVTHTLTNVAVFPNGTSVGAYPASRWPVTAPENGVAPIGSATNSQTMTSGTLTFTGLTANTRYYASDSSGTRYVGFTAGEDLSKVDDVAVDTDGTLAADSDSRLASQKAVKTYVDSVGGSSVPADNSVTSAKIAAGAIVNDDVNASAAIAYSKLNLAASIVNADVNASAAIASTKINPEPVGKTLVDAKGDILTATAADTPARLAVGSNEQFLVADSAEATGLKWTSGNAELGYAEITSTYTQTGAGNSDVTGLSTTVTVGARPIVIRVFCGQCSNSNASGLMSLAIKESTTVLAFAMYGTGTVTVPLTAMVRLAPSAGSHTYKANLIQTVTGNSVMSPSATNPAFIQVLQV